MQYFQFQKHVYQIKQLMNVTYKLQENINIFSVFVEIKNRNEISLHDSIN